MRLGSWRDGFIRPTRQYLAGTLGGFGIGLVTGSWLSWGWHPLVVIPGFALSALGAYLAKWDQQRHPPQEACDA